MLKQGKYNIKKLAFTLAEVLITLGIIGVVAAITIPILYSVYEEQQYNTGCKKAFQTISNALGIVLSKDNYIDANSGDTALRTEFANAMTFIKTGAQNQIFVDSKNTAIWYQFYKSIPAAVYPPFAAGSASAILSDGSYIGFSSRADCNTVNICADIAIDINGAAGPNTVGKDFYYFLLKKKNNTFKIEPGGLNDGTSCVVGAMNLMYEYGCTLTRLQGNMP